MTTTTSAFPAPQEQGHRVADEIVAMLVRLGAEYAFGVVGGACATLADALHRSPIRFVHMRHEAGAAFAAAEASLASGKPAVVLTTTGPGVLNAINGLVAARWDGATVISLCATSNHAQSGRLPIQETSPYTMPSQALFSSGPWFDYATLLNDAAELPEIERRLLLGARRVQGFVANVGVPTSLQAKGTSWVRRELGVARASVAADHLAAVADILVDGWTAVLVGSGARKAAPAVRALVERLGAPAFSSPRGKGIIPESARYYLGVCGAGGHNEVGSFMASGTVDRLLVLGSRLGEATTCWDSRLVPRKGIVHVDIDPAAFGAAYPAASTIGVEAEIGAFVDAILPLLPRAPPPLHLGTSRAPMSTVAARPGPIRLAAVMGAVQRVVVDGSDAVVMAESGNAFGFGNHHLRFDEPSRYRSSAAWGSMGHMSCGVVGAALARNKKAVAIVGDGAMLMVNEVHTAVQERIDAVWIVLNDGAFGIVRDGMKGLGLESSGLSFKQVDFASVADALGCRAVRVDDELELDAALRQALSDPGPFVVDVRVGVSERSPAIAGRVSSLQRPR